MCLRLHNEESNFAEMAVDVKRHQSQITEKGYALIVLSEQVIKLTAEVQELKNHQQKE